MIRIVVADDHNLVRAGIIALLSNDGELEVVGEAVDGDAAIAQVLATLPDVLIVDVTMPGRNGIEVTREISERGLATAVVVLSMHGDRAMARQALQAGARAYVQKSDVTEELLVAIRAARQGATYISPALSHAMVSGPAPEDEAAEFARPLTEREAEVLALVATGLTSRAIAIRLGIREKTVERHRANLMAKLGVDNVVDLLRRALKLGLVRLDDGD